MSFLVLVLLGWLVTVALAWSLLAIASRADRADDRRAAERRSRARGRTRA